MIQQLGVPGHLLEQISLDQCFRHTVKAVSVCFQTFEIRVLHVNSSPPVCRIGFALLEITVHSYDGASSDTPPHCICCYLSFAILPQPVPAPYFSGVFSGKTRRMHIQHQKYLSGMAYSVVKELCKVLFSLTLTLIWIWRGLGGYSFQRFFEFFYPAFIFNGLSKHSSLFNLIFFIEISCNAAFQRTTACKFGLDGIFTAPIDIRRTDCHFFCLPGILAHLLFPFHVKSPTANS